MSYLPDFADELSIAFYVLLPMALSVLIGIVAMGIAWGGRPVGSLFGVLALLGGVCVLGGLLLTAPRLWWISLVPMATGATALLLGGIVSQIRQSRIEAEAAQKLQTLAGGKSNLGS